MSASPDLRRRLGGSGDQDGQFPGSAGTQEKESPDEPSSVSFVK